MRINLALTKLLTGNANNANKRVKEQGILFARYANNNMKCLSYSNIPKLVEIQFIYFVLFGTQEQQPLISASKFYNLLLTLVLQ
jgi:hypothetical protein